MKILENMKNVFFAVFAERAKIWGVEFETRFPSEFVITNHAEDRIRERVSVKPKKMMRMVVKAWGSKETVPRLNKLAYAVQFGEDPKFMFYRMFMGYVWIFRTMYRKNCQTPQKILITVYRHV